MLHQDRRRISAVIGVFASVIGSAAVAADEIPAAISPVAAFGVAGQTTLSVWSFQFQGRDPFNDNIVDDLSGYRTMTDPNDSFNFIAGISLPAGIYIEQIELDNCDSQPAGNLNMVLYDSFGDHEFTAIANVVSTDKPGCGRNFFTLPTPYYYPANLGHYLSLYVKQSMVDPTLKFRGAMVSYRQSISPAPATASFNDVPTTDQGFRFIEALVAAGITGGCGGNPPLPNPVFCPNSPVTRRQMAIFLSIALGLHHPN